MFKSEDLYKKDIYDDNGKLLGHIKDIIIDFINGRIIEFDIEDSLIKNKDLYFISTDINKSKVKYNLKQKNWILFSKLKNMQVIDSRGKEKGVVEDLIVDEKSLNIIGLILKSNDINEVDNEILLIKNIKMKDGYLYYYGGTNITFKNILG